MKIRNGWVSNSSTSCFVVQIDDCSLDKTTDTSVAVNDASRIDSIDNFSDCGYCCEC